jgi:elongator complex protein 3
MKNINFLIKDIIKIHPKNEDEILVLKRRFAKDNKIKIPKNSELLLVYRKMVKKKIIKKSAILEQLLKKRQIRTASGVAPIAVLTKPYKCPGKCLYCPSEKNMPKSYLSNEPAVMRADLCDFHPFKQVALRINALKNNGHDTDKLELIVMGGTWDYLPEKYRLWYIYACFAAANRPLIKITEKKITIDQKIKLKNISEVSWKDLAREQKKNETAKHRIVGLTLETRPDYVSEKSVLEMRELGCTRVELGIQHIDDKILKLNKRGATTADTIRATKILRDFGFKITYHLMLNLLGSNPKKDYELFVELFKNPNFQPDQIKIYPCVVNENAELYKFWKAKKYKPYSTLELKKLLEKIKKIIPYFVRVIRVIRDIPEESIVAGNRVTNLRDLLDVKCKCIRCREVGHQDKLKMKNEKLNTRGGSALGGKIKLFIQKYKVSGGVEYFFSYESLDRKILYAFCRLGLREGRSLSAGVLKGFFGTKADKLATIRELHTYGQMVPIKCKIKSASQHKGLGKKLLIEAEKLARQNGFEKIAVISGIGVKEYYRKLGYEENNTYMVKDLK